MRIYMDGVGGMLGIDLYKIFNYKANELRCSDKDANELWLHELDFTDHAALFDDVVSFNPDMLFHIGAMTDLEECEREPDKAYLNNVIGTENAVMVANYLDIPIVYISTAGIFDGSKRSYDDWDQPNPINVYGRTKYLGEQYVVNHAKQYYVFRAGWMIGGHNKDKKFVKKIVDQLRDGATELYVVHDKYGSPTYTLELARTIMRATIKPRYGVYNATNTGSPSRLDVARVIVDELGYNVNIRPVASTCELMRDKYSASRPMYEVLENKRLQLLGINEFSWWDMALIHYLRAHK